MPVTHSTIFSGDCIALMREMPAGTVDLAFADPPFNIGYSYDSYHDEQSDDDYLSWSREWMAEIHRLLKPSGTFWLAIGDEYAADLKVIADRELGFTTRSWVVWYYTFGVNCKRKFSRSHTHLFHLVKDAEAFTFLADDPAVRIPSARALVYGDKRANPHGRLPDDTWILRPQDFQSDPYGFSPLDDTWYFARVAGTFKERQGFHGCQMPEQLLGRIIRISSNPGEVVFDPFVGSGTTLAVAKKLGREWLGCELSDAYVEYASQRLAGVSAGDLLDGPADPIASAPTTANGRRLQGVIPTPHVPHKNVTAKGPAKAKKMVATPANGSAKAALTTMETKLSPAPTVDLRQLQQQALVDSYLAAADGLSVDRLLADPELQIAFHSSCRQAGLLGTPAVWNHELVKLRKSGKLPKRPRAQVPTVPRHALDEYQFAAEIAWKLTREEYGIDSIDEILSDVECATYFDEMATRYVEGPSAADLRWAALDFRKSRHTLSVLAEKYAPRLRRKKLEGRRRLTERACQSLAGQRGVYLLYGKRNVPLYLGSTLDLGKRLEQHATAPATAEQVTGFAVLLASELQQNDHCEPLKVVLAKRYEPLLNL